MDALHQEVDERYAAVVANASDGALTHLPIDAVDVKPGFNPRRYFAPAKMQELADDIRERGLVQPLVVRPNERRNAFWLIAGERRLRAARMVGLPDIPVIVRFASEAEATAMATAENLQRDDMSAAEEGRVAHRIVSLCDGDRAEAARMLGWSRAKLDARLALLNCSEAVLTALEQRQILLGHAELLAGLTHELQDQSLPGIIEKKLSVAEVKEFLGRYAYRLADAVFDVAACVGCQHNSGSVGDLFDIKLSDGHCLNRECYDDKTERFLIEKKSVLSEEYPVIWLDSEKDAESRVYLQREGRDGVGRAQFAACQDCAHHGALMYTAKGKEGQVESGLCFDVTCHADKVAAQRQVSAESSAATADKGNDSEAARDTGKQSSAQAGSATGKRPRAGAKAAALPTRVADFIRDVHSAAVTQEVAADPRLVKVVSAYALMERNRSGERAIAALRAAGLKPHRTGRHEIFTALLALSGDALDALIAGLAAGVAGESGYSRGDELRGARVLLKGIDADLGRHFVVNKAYLDTLTIAAILELLDEAKFGAWYDAQRGAGAFKGFAKGKRRGDLIDAIIASGFDWQGFVPKAVAL